MNKLQIAKLAAVVLVCELAGFAGSGFVSSSMRWYDGLAKPGFNPPDSVFAPVWTILYALMGVAVFLVWRRHRHLHRALNLFVIQLVLNVAWNFFFFWLHRPDLAFAEIIVLFLTILCTMLAFAKISRPAMWLLLPYLLWVGFAAYLNFSIWQLNKDSRTILNPFDTALAAPANGGLKIS